MQHEHFNLLCDGFSAFSEDATSQERKKFFVFCFGADFEFPLAWSWKCEEHRKADATWPKAHIFVKKQNQFAFLHNAFFFSANGVPAEYNAYKTTQWRGERCWRNIEKTKTVIIQILYLLKSRLWTGRTYLRTNDFRLGPNLCQFSKQGWTEFLETASNQFQTQWSPSWVESFARVFANSVL